MRTTLLEIAAHNDHLLYAVVGFAAYHHALSKPNGRISDFLSYYSKSVQLLLLSLQRNQRRTPATLLTILQLATIEVRVGDIGTICARIDDLDRNISETTSTLLDTKRQHSK